MTTKNKVLIGTVTSLAVIGLTIYMSRRKSAVKKRKRLERISDEGYETAYDILYPLQKKPLSRFF